MGTSAPCIGADVLLCCRTQRPEAPLSGGVKPRFSLSFRSCAVSLMLLRKIFKLYFIVRVNSTLSS